MTSVASPTDAAISGSTVTFPVADLEDSPEVFSVVVDTCALSDGTVVVSSATYTDNDGNTPDLSVLTSNGDVVACEDDKGRL